MDTKFGLIVTFILKPDADDAFDERVRQLVSAVHDHEPNTLVFACHAIEGRTGQRLFYELYRDRAAFDAHGNQEHTKRFIAERDRYVADIRVDFLQLVDGTGV